ncbi:MAG: restriction endonuclease [Colwellia sp.]|nr:restriction endonuclease [Colwellia sp.]
MSVIDKFIKFITTSGENELHEAEESIFDRIRDDFINVNFCYFLPTELYENYVMVFDSYCSEAFSEKGYNDFVVLTAVYPEEIRPRNQFEYNLGLSLSILKNVLTLKFLYENNYVSKLQSVEQKYQYVDEFGDIVLDEVFKKLTKFSTRHFYSLTTGLIDDLPAYLIRSSKTVTNNPFDFEQDNAGLIAHELFSCIDDVNTMSGNSVNHLSGLETDITDPYEYEEYIAQNLISLDWDAYSTKGSGDQGADVLAEKNGIKLVVQCKLYGQPVGNKAVQEVYSAKGFYGCDVAIVVTNSSFTKSAMQLASSLDVHLLHDSELPDFSLKCEQSVSPESVYVYVTEDHDTFDGFPANETNFVENVAEELNELDWEVPYDEDDTLDGFGNFNKLITANKNGFKLLGHCIHYEKYEIHINEVKDFCEFFIRNKKEYDLDIGIIVLKNNVSKELSEEFNKLNGIEKIYLISLNSISQIDDLVL